MSNGQPPFDSDPRRPSSALSQASIARVAVNKRAFQTRRQDAECALLLETFVVREVAVQVLGELVGSRERRLEPKACIDIMFGIIVMTVTTCDS